MSTIETIRSVQGVLKLKIFANGLYAIVDKAFTDPDDLKDLSSFVDFDINGFTTATLDIKNLIGLDDLSVISDETLNELFNEFIKNHLDKVGLETAQDNIDRIESGSFYKIYANFDSDKLFDLGVIASGMCFQLDPKDTYQNLVLADLSFLNNDLSIEPFIDQIYLHPRFPYYAVPTNTFSRDKNSLGDINCLFFNYYGEFIKIGYLAGQSLNNPMSVDSHILTNGFSNSYDFNSDDLL